MEKHKAERKGRDDLLPLWVADMDFSFRRRSLRTSGRGSIMGFLATRIRTRNTLMR